MQKDTRPCTGKHASLHTPPRTGGGDNGAVKHTERVFQAVAASASAFCQ